jgi:hypothetical protein
MKNLLRGILGLVLVVSLGAIAVDRLGTSGSLFGTMPSTEATIAPSAEAPSAPSAQTPPTRSMVAQVQDATAAIQQVIQRSNDEQAQAIASGNPSAMSDTVTDDHYQELVKINQNLLDHDVKSISLIGLDWGPINVNGSTATATTFETWRTTYSDGRTEQSRDQNDYALVLDTGVWKIQTNDHPTTASAPPPQRPVPSNPGIPDNQNTSHNWSGYAATGGNYTAVTGTWTVPEFKADGSFGIDAAWVGIGGVRSRDLIQAGTSQTVSGSGSSQYEAWIEMLPRASETISLPVHPGDSVTVSISEQSRDNWLIAFKNNTTGQSYQENVTYASSHSSVEWVQEAPSAGRGGLLPLSDFGSIEFSDGSAVKDGQTVTIAGAGARPITMLNNANQALAVPSPLQNDGASFSIARTDAAATTTAGPRPGRGRRGG